MAFKRGHYIDSGLSPEEREKACIEAEKENEKCLQAGMTFPLFMKIRTKINTINAA